MDVFDAVKDREDWKKLRLILILNEEWELGQAPWDKVIAVPHFQLAVLRWLIGDEKVDAVLKGGGE